MELREQFPTMTDVRQLEQLGFSREQIAGLVRVKALYQRGHITRPILSTTDKRLSAGSTCRVAWKANLRSRCMCEGGWGVEDACDPRSSISLTQLYKEMALRKRKREYR